MNIGFVLKSLRGERSIADIAKRANRASFIVASLETSEFVNLTVLADVLPVLGFYKLSDFFKYCETPLPFKNSKEQRQYLREYDLTYIEE